MSSPPPLQGLLLVLSAPSGAGKTTLAHRLIDDCADALFSISFTTRKPRGREQDGIDYTFLDEATFQEKIERDEFVEWAEVHGNFYGSPRSVVDQARSKNGMAVFDIDVQGGQAIKRRYPDAVLVFVVPPSMTVLDRRLRDRQTDAEETIRRRMLGARSEIQKGLSSYDYVIVNDEIDKAYQQLRAIVTAERCRRERVQVSHLLLERPSEPPAGGAPG
jgi:guanylate kinase